MPDFPPNKAGHCGVTAGPFGPHVYVLQRHDGKMVGVHPDRHSAVGQAVLLHDCDDYEPVRVPVGDVPIADLALNGGGGK